MTTGTTQRIGTGECFNCNWTRSAVLTDGRIIFSAFHAGSAHREAPKLRHECRIWAALPTLDVEGDTKATNE